MDKVKGQLEFYPSLSFIFINMFYIKSFQLQDIFINITALVAKSFLFFLSKLHISNRSKVFENEYKKTKGKSIEVNNVLIRSFWSIKNIIRGNKY